MHMARIREMPPRLDTYMNCALNYSAACRTSALIWINALGYFSLAIHEFTLAETHSNNRKGFYSSLSQILITHTHHVGEEQLDTAQIVKASSI